MSIILDALKKSETERQQSGSAEFAIVPASPDKPGIPRWLLLVGVLLAINLIVLLGLLLRSDDPLPPAQPSAVETRPPAAETQSSTFEEQVARAKQSPPRNVPQEVVEQVAEAPPQLQADLISRNPDSVAAEDLYPTIQEVRVTNTIALPDLHLDIHVFSEVPKDRFVFINMAKLREGSRMAEGPEVVEIRPDGVVLRHLGTTFMVPRE